MLLEVRCALRFLISNVSVLVKEHGRNLSVFEHLTWHNGSSLENNTNCRCVDIFFVLCLRSLKPNHCLLGQNLPKKLWTCIGWHKYNLKNLRMSYLSVQLHDSSVWHAYYCFIVHWLSILGCMVISVAALTNTTNLAAWNIWVGCSFNLVVSMCWFRYRISMDFLLMHP